MNSTYELELLAIGFDSRSLPRWSDERALEREKMPELLLFEFCDDLGTVAVDVEFPLPLPVPPPLPPPLLLDPPDTTVGGAGEGDLFGPLLCLNKST